MDNNSNGQTHVNQTMTSTNFSKAKSAASSKPKSAAKPKKIPRPANAFLIYRREHAKAYPGLVATELSTKLAQAWKDETPERQALYFRKAEKLKQEHAINYPNWKFTPRKRGTGKRALQLAAIASASKKAVEHPVVFFPAPNAGTMKSRSLKICATTMSPTTYPASPSVVAGIKAEPSDSISLSNRPRRNVQRPQRYSPASPYSYTPSSSSVTSPTISSDANYCSSSLFFHIGGGAAQWSTMQPVPSQYQESIRSPTSSTTSSSSRFSTDGNCYGENDDGEYEEVDVNVKTEEDTSTTQISEALCQLLKRECEREGLFSPHCVPTLPTPPYQEEPFMFNVATFPSLLSMESFEPECLARDDAQWAATTNALCPIMSTPTMSNCSSTSSYSSSPSTPLSSSSSSYGYSASSYENCSPSLHFPMDIAISAALMPTPLTTPLYPPILSSQQSRSSASSAQSMQLPSFPFEISTPLRIPADLMMSPALSSCSAMSPNMSKSLPEAQNYIASAFEWL